MSRRQPLVTLCVSCKGEAVSYRALFLLWLLTVHNVFPDSELLI